MLFFYLAKNNPSCSVERWRALTQILNHPSNQLILQDALAIPVKNGSKPTLVTTLLQHHQGSAIVYLKMPLHIYRPNRPRELHGESDELLLRQQAARHGGALRVVTAEHHAQQVDAELWAPLDVVVGEGDHLVTHGVQEGFAIELVAEFLTVHIANVRSVTFDLEQQLQLAIPRKPGEVGKIKSPPPIADFILRMEAFEVTAQRPPDIPQELGLRMGMSTLQTSSSFP